MELVSDDPVDRGYILFVHGVFLFFLLFMVASSSAFVYKIILLYQQKVRDSNWGVNQWGEEIGSQYNNLSLKNDVVRPR